MCERLKYKGLEIIRYVCASMQNSFCFEPVLKELNELGILLIQM